jgi:small subunit ribosomal protein S2
MAPREMISAGSERAMVSGYGPCHPALATRPLPRPLAPPGRIAYKPAIPQARVTRRLPQDVAPVAGSPASSSFAEVQPEKRHMALPDFNMRGLLEAGAHFGHQAHRWNPKMAPYIFGARNNIHIIDLAQTVPLLHQALKTISDTVSKGGRVLFVGTKRQAQEQIADAAKRSAQYYINSRWLGGTLTNWKTISGSINRLRKLDEMLSAGASGITKKERLLLTRERDKLEKALGGIKDMGGTPDLIFVIDTNKEQLAIKEANRLKIPVVAVLDTNCDPDGVTHPIPGNDDAGRAIALYCDLVARAAIDGISRSQGAMGIDIGAEEAPALEPALEAGAPGAVESAGADVEAPGEPFELLSAPRGAPDDLAKLHGVGPQLVKKLNDAGVYHYWQIAAMAPGDVEKLDADLKLNGRIARDGWVDQAKALLAA